MAVSLTKLVLGDDASVFQSNGAKFRIARRLARESWSDQQRSLLRLLALSHRDGLDATTLVTAFVHENRGAYRSVLRRLSRRMQSGLPLIEALEQTPEALSDDDVLALRLGNRSGTLNSTFAMLMEQGETTEQPMGLKGRSLLDYWLLMGGLLIVLILLFSYFIRPNIQDVFDELGDSEIGSGTNFLILSEWTFKVGMFCLALIVALILIGWSQPIRVAVRRALSLRWTATVSPVSTASVLRVLGVSVLNGRPLVGSLSTLAKYHAQPRLRQQLLLARNEIEQGMDAWESLRLARILKPSECSALRMNEEPASQSWILNRLADKREQLSERRRSLAILFLHPILVIIFGLLVFWLAYSVLGNLYGLTTSLAS